MRYWTLLVVCLIFCWSCQPGGTTGEKALGTTQPDAVAPAYAMVIHGGAGTILKENMTPEREASYRETLNEALNIGEAILVDGGSSTEAVIATIKFMEDSPLFNAGKGAVYTYAAEHELDASIMRGSDQNAGAVGGVKNIKNPITAAQAVLDHSDHVLLSGAGAEQFALEQGLETVENSYFDTESRRKALEKVQNKATGWRYDGTSVDSKFGTVGCVALDQEGNIVAGTSTGGMTNKRYNRFGDSPIIGAGTYADNATCGVSCTGHGEYFIRYAVAYDVAARMAYGGNSLEEAANAIVMDKLVEKGGGGGIIALDAQGNIAMPFNTAGMYRGWVKPDGERYVGIYKEE